MLKQQFASEIEYQKATIRRLEEEKRTLTRTVEKLKEEHKRSERENLSATYGKVRELENEIQALYQTESSGTNSEAKRLKLEDELESRTRHYRRLIAQKDEELNVLKNYASDKRKDDHIVTDLKNQIQTLKDENLTYSKQITVLKKELAVQEKFFQEEHSKLQKVYEKEIDAARAQAKQLAEILETRADPGLSMSQAQTVVSESDALLLEAAKEKIDVLEQELRLQEAHFKKVTKEKDDIIAMLKEKLMKGTKDVEEMKKGMNRLQFEVHEAKAKLNKDNYEKKTKDMKIAELSQRVKDSAKIVTPPKEAVKKEQKIVGLSEILNTWKRFYDDDNIKCDLLLKTIQDPDLKGECIEKSLQQYLLMLYQAFTSDKPILYEAATVCLNELVGLKKIEPSEFKALCCEHKVISALIPQRLEENEASAINRHSAAIGILCYMDNINHDWTPAMTERMIEINGLGTLKFYIENFEEFEGIAIIATQVSAYISSYKENTRLLREIGISNAILSAINASKSTELKRNAAECLAILIKDAETRELLEQDDRVGKLILELSGQTDILYQENLLLCFVNLTVSKVFKQLLYDDGLIDAILPILGLPGTPKAQTEETSILYTLKIVANMSYPGCPGTFLPKLILPLSKALGSSKDCDVLHQALLTVQKVVEDDSGKLLQEYKKLLPAILPCLKSPEDMVVEQALKAFSTICKYSGSQLLNEANIKGEVIKLCVLFYCTHENGLVVSASQGVLWEYAEKGYAKDIGGIGKITLLEKLFMGISAEDEETRVNALKILAYLAADPTSREKVLALAGIQDSLNNFLDIIAVPTPLAPDEAYNMQILSQNRKEIEWVVKILAELSASSTAFDTLMNRETVLKNFVNIMYTDGYPKNAKINSVKGISNMCARKGNRGIMNTLVKIPGGKFLEGLSELLFEKDENVYKAAVPLCELLAIEARQGNTLLCAAIRKNAELIDEFKELAKITQTNRTGIGKLLQEFLLGLAANDKQIEGLLKA